MSWVVGCVGEGAGVGMKGQEGRGGCIYSAEQFKKSVRVSNLYFVSKHSNCPLLI